MKSQYICSMLVLLMSLSACVPTPRPSTQAPIAAESATPIPTIASSETPAPTDVLPTNTPAPSIKITKLVDDGQLSCDNPATAVFCVFTVQGTISGLSSFSDYRVYVFVFPVAPAGEGWYLQKSPASIESNGDWEQSPAYLGNVTFPAKAGDTLKIRAVLVRADATYKGTPLADLANLKEEIVLQAVEDIDGDVAISDTVRLTLNK